MITFSAWIRTFLISLLLISVIQAFAADRKPALLFVSWRMRDDVGGAYVKENLNRLSKTGYRVAWYNYPQLYSKKSKQIHSFDTVIILDPPGVDFTGDYKLKPETKILFAELKHFLASGGGMLVFNTASRPYRMAFDELMYPYGVNTMTGAFIDPQAVLATHGCIRYAYTSEISKDRLCEGVKGFWYPVAGSNPKTTHHDSLRNANSYPFDVTKDWTILAWTRPTTYFKPFTKQEGADTSWEQQKRFTKMKQKPPPLVAVREKVEGKGRLGVCAINMAFTDFCAGNTVYDGVCTGKGLEGRPSDLNTLLMNVVNWLSEPSLKEGRTTIAKSDTKSFEKKPFKFAKPMNVNDTRPILANPDQFQGIVGVRSVYSGGKSTVAEYAKIARKLGIQYVIFLEEFAKLKEKDFEKLKKECADNSDNKLILIPGIRIQAKFGINFFGFSTNLTLPQKSHLLPGTKRLSIHDPTPGQYLWSTKNGARQGMGCGNFRLEEKEPGGVPPEDYNVHNPFISIYTYQNGKLVDTMMNTYLTCAARTEWVSPISINLIDSAEGLEREWKSDHFRTVYLRPPGQGLEGFKKSIGERGYFLPVTYVTNGPKIDAWHSSNLSADGGFWDWTRMRLFVRMKVSSDAGIKEVVVMDGKRKIRTYRPKGAKSFEHTMVLPHNDMRNLILIVTDNRDRKAISDEIWTKNALFQLTWCADRNNMLSYSGLPAPKAASGSMAGNFPAPTSMEKGGFRENLLPFINQDRSRLPHFDGQPMHLAHISPTPLIYTKQGAEGGGRISRWIGRDKASPDVAIQTAGCSRIYDKSVKRVHPWLKGPLVPMKFFNADLRYITFSHQGHEPAPVILEGKITFLKDVSVDTKNPVPIQVLTINYWRKESGYKTATVQYSKDGNIVTNVNYTNQPTLGKDGALNKGTYIYVYPSIFGSVGLFALDDQLSFSLRNKHIKVGFDARGKTFKKGDTLSYRVLAFVSGFDEIASTRLPEAMRKQMGLNVKGTVSYNVITEQGKIVDQRYILTIDGQKKGFAGEITLPRYFPAALPVVIENLNDKWSSVLYDRNKKRLRNLGMHDNKAYCHRGIKEQKGKLFIGHPFTADNSDLWISAVQTNKGKITLQIHNPTDKDITTTIKRSPFFDFVNNPDFKCQINAGETVEYTIKGKELKKIEPKNN